MVTLFISISTVIFFSTIFFTFLITCDSDAGNADSITFSKENLKKIVVLSSEFDDHPSRENQGKPEKFVIYITSKEDNDVFEDKKPSSKDVSKSSENSEDQDLVDSVSRYISSEETSEEKRNKMEKPGMLSQIWSKIGWDSTLTPSQEEKEKETKQKRKDKLEEKKNKEKAKRLKYIKKGLPDINVAQYNEDTYNLCSELEEQKEDELRDDLVPTCQLVCLYRKIHLTSYSTSLDSRCKRERVSTVISGLRRETGYANFVCYCNQSRYTVAKYFQVRKILYSIYTEGMATEIVKVHDFIEFLSTELMNYRKEYISHRNKKFRRKYWWKRFLINAQEEDSWLSSVTKYVPQINKNPLKSIPILPKSKSR